MLRLMIWYAMVAEDPQVDEALAWLAQARWKTKEAGDRAATADNAFCYVLAQRDPEAARQVFERMIQSGRAVEGTKIHAAYLKLSEQTGTPPVEARASQQKGPDLEALKAKRTKIMKQGMLQGLGGGCSWEGDILVVQVGEETYQIDAITGRITRGSDGAVLRVEIPYEYPPYKFIRPQIDAHDFQHPGEPNLMRTIMCAMALKRGLGGGAAIVVDSTAD
jgi:hypothetical protein